VAPPSNRCKYIEEVMIVFVGTWRKNDTIVAQYTVGITIVSWVIPMNVIPWKLSLVLF